MKMKPFNKPQGRPKHSGTVWPSKSKGKRKKRLIENAKENIPSAKMAKPMNTLGTPAYRAKLRRNQKKCTIVDSYDLTGLEIEETVRRINSSTVVIGYEKLTMSDLGYLTSLTGWLNDKLINAGQIMLQEKFSSMHGLQNVFLVRTLSFVKQNSPFVQILNIDDSHWVCVAATTDCKFNSVKTFYSRKTGELLLQTKEAIATVLHCDKRTISVIYPTIQQQTDGVSCGLFALAFAYSVCEGKNSSEIIYHEPR